MKPLYAFDLDGTLADLTHRLHYVKKPSKPGHGLLNAPTEKFKPNWTAFFEEVDKDKPIWWVMALLSIVRQHGEVLILSGRSDEAEVKTKAWLHKWNVMYDYLVMRKKGDHTPDYILKEKMLDDFLRDKDFEVQFIVDDRQVVVDMWRRNGYNVLQCNKWDE